MGWDAYARNAQEKGGEGHACPLLRKGMSRSGVDLLSTGRHVLDNVVNPLTGFVHAIPRDALRRRSSQGHALLLKPSSGSGPTRPVEDGGDNGQAVYGTPTI